MKNKAIQVIKDELNRMIADAQTPERRADIKLIGTNLLMAAKQYNGFNYTDWLEDGYRQWIAAGQPQDNTKYLGDQTKVVFY